MVYLELSISKQSAECSFSYIMSPPKKNTFLRKHTYNIPHCYQLCKIQIQTLHYSFDLSLRKKSSARKGQYVLYIDSWTCYLLIGNAFFLQDSTYTSRSFRCYNPAIHRVYFAAIFQLSIASISRLYSSYPSRPFRGEINAIIAATSRRCIAVI